MQNKGRFIKINFEKTNQNLELSSKIIHIIFYSEKNTLLSEGLKNNKNLSKLLQSFLVSNSVDNIIVRSEKGTFLLVKRKTKDGDITNQYLEELGGRIFNDIKSIGFSEASIYENNIEINRQISLGILLSSYKFDNYKNRKPKQLINIKKITFICEEPKKNIEIFQEVKNIAAGVFSARDLVWQPPNILFPSSFAEECKKLKKIGVKITILNEMQLEKIGMEALLAVGRGSRKESRVVIMEWRGGKKDILPMAFIGKGVCFDSGGLSLKPPKSMEDMKWDMGGAATVTGL